MGKILGKIVVKAPLIDLVGQNLLQVNHIHQTFNEYDPAYAFVSKSGFEKVMTKFHISNPSKLSKDFEYSRKMAVRPICYYDFICALIIVGNAKFTDKKIFIF